MTSTVPSQAGVIGPYSLWHEPHYYVGASEGEEPDYIRDGEGRVRTFASPAEAWAYVGCSFRRQGQHPAAALTVVASPAAN